MIAKDTELGRLIEVYQNLDGGMQKQLLGYMTALSELNQNEK